MKVSITFDISDYQRYAIAYLAYRQEFSLSDWNANPHKATRAEIVSYIENCYWNDAALMDDVPNLNDDGIVDRRSAIDFGFIEDEE
jgi:hypothetical protein